MPHFYFHLYNQIGFVPDEEGEDLPDLATAKSRAIENIRSILAGEIGEGRVDLRGRIEIAREDGPIVASVRFAEALELYQEGGK